MKTSENLYFAPFICHQFISCSVFFKCITILVFVFCLECVCFSFTIRNRSSASVLVLDEFLNRLSSFPPGIQMLSVQPDTKPKGCAGCNRKIKDRYLLKALDKYWHEDCLKCACCDCRLGEVGSTLYTKANLILCRRDYLR